MILFEIIECECPSNYHRASQFLVKVFIIKPRAYKNNYCKCLWVSLKCIAHGPSFVTLLLLANVYYAYKIISHPSCNKGSCSSSCGLKKHALLMVTFCLILHHCMLYQVIQIHQLLPLQWQLHVHYHLASYVYPKEIGIHVILVIVQYLLY